MTKVLYLYDDITSALAKQFVADMAKLKPDEAVTIAVNSPGGSVPAGDTTALALDRHAGPTTARIDGLAASAASFVAMFCDRVVVAPSAFFMLHNPYVEMLAGDAKRVGDVAKELAAIETRYALTYSVRSGLPEATVRKMMDLETWLNAKKAIELGFADEIDRMITPATAVAKSVLKFHHVPEQVKAMASGKQNAASTAARRQRLKRRFAIINTMAAGAAETATQREDRERGERVRKRRELCGVVERGQADAALRDAQERAQAKRRIAADYFFDHARVPHSQRRYD